jgi:hypothetical protein
LRAGRVNAYLDEIVSTLALAQVRDVPSIDVQQLVTALHLCPDRERNQAIGRNLYPLVESGSVRTTIGKDLLSMIAAVHVAAQIRRVGRFERNQLVLDFPVVDAIIAQHRPWMPIYRQPRGHARAFIQRLAGRALKVRILDWNSRLRPSYQW